MKVKEAAQNTAEQFGEAVRPNPALTSALSKQYLESVRGHYLSAIAGINMGKQEQTKIFYNVGAFSALEYNDSDQAAEAEQASMQGLLEQGQSFMEMDMQIHLSKGVMGTSEKNLQAIKAQVNKTLAANIEEDIPEMVSRIEAFGQDTATEASGLEANRAVLGEPGTPEESIVKGVIENSTLQRKVKSLKAQLENLKKEHAELKDKGAAAESCAGNLHFKIVKSKFEDEGCFVKEAKVRQTLEEAVQNQQVEDLKIRGKGLKREHETSKVPIGGEKKSRVDLDVDEAKVTKVNVLVRNKSLPGRMYPASVSTSESSARMMIPEDELEASSLKEEKSDKLESGELGILTRRLDSETYDYASEFSIRDFVFSARNKDISLNWPFSQKNLQLCLKRGVKDVLPPFQPMDSLRDSSMKRYVAVTSCNSEESNLHNRPVQLKNHLATGSTNDHRWNQELAEGYRDSDSFPSAVEKDLAFKTTATANSEVESVSTSNLPLSEVSDERVAVASAVNEKMNSSASQLCDKKCQVPLKIRISTCRSAAEDITSACTVPCEAMTSKICPVCEAFSSSSNTTLNAHIDQCLSSQSTPNWINSKSIKPRVKPRKIRLMSDICATALRCTLEDLDRRNGTNWATNVECPAQDIEVDTEGKSQRVSSRCLSNNGDDGAVYIDSSGRKIRILSKFNDMSSLSLPKSTKDSRSEQQSKNPKTTRFFLSTRKRRLAKHLKYLKVNRQKKRVSSLKVKGHPYEAFGAREPTSTRGEKHEDEQGLAQFAKTEEQKNAGVSESSRLWTSSSTFSLSKKYDSKNINGRCRYELRATKERQAPNHPFGNGRMHIKRHSGSLKKCVFVQQRSLKSPGFYRPVTDESSEGSYKKRMLDGPLLTGPVEGNMESYPVPLKLGAAQFDGANTKGLPKSMDSTIIPSSSLEAEVYGQADAVEYADNLFSDSRKLLDSSRAGPFREMRSQNSKNHPLSPGCSPVRPCQSNSNQSSSPLEKPFGSERNGKGDLWSTGRSQQSNPLPDLHESGTSTDSLDHCSMMKVQKRRGLEVCDDVSIDHNSIDGLPGRSQSGYGHFRSTIIGVCDNGEVIAPISSSGLSVEETVSLGSSSVPESQKIVDVLGPKSKSFPNSDKFEVPLFGTEAGAPRNETELRDDDEMLYRNAVGAETLRFDAGGSHFSGEHESFFPEVDPILIPGPPGSDLPSFSDMGSEDLHRNSSLSGGLVQSSGDVDCVDGELSESPLSATSTISNMGVKDDHTISDSLTVALPVSNSVYPGWLCSSPEPMIGTSAMFSHFPFTGTERFASQADSSNKSLTAQGQDPVILNADSQQCYCTRKEGIPWSSELTFEESELPGPKMGTIFTLPSGKPSKGTNFPDSRTAGLPLICCTRGESQNLTYPIENLRQGTKSVEVTADVGISFPRTSDCNLSSPSAPTLRLMGKDLMVINKEQDDLSRNQTAQYACTNNQVLPVSEPYSGFPSWHLQSSQSTVFLAPPVPEQDPHTFAMRHFEFGPSNMMSNSKNPKQASGGIYLNKQMHASFTMPYSSSLHR